ncbi:hypothetical protein [Pseudarthrobacter sp. H2]|uniref:hypothetical protein n=1 Tax=Pseudarthrobacter sp. H2 TaxID=3418415 RepID=UPI003CE768EC
MTDPQMLLCLQLTSGYGAQPGAWRLPGVNAPSYTDMDVFVRYAQAAERGKIQLLSFADTPTLDVDLDHEPPHFAMDPLLTLTSIARETERIGLVTGGLSRRPRAYTLHNRYGLTVQKGCAPRYWLNSADTGPPP